MVQPEDRQRWEQAREAKLDTVAGLRLLLALRDDPTPDPDHDPDGGPGDPWGGPQPTGFAGTLGEFAVRELEVVGPRCVPALLELAADEPGAIPWLVRALAHEPEQASTEHLLRAADLIDDAEQALRWRNLATLRRGDEQGPPSQRRVELALQAIEDTDMGLIDARRLEDGPALLVAALLHPAGSPRTRRRILTYLVGGRVPLTPDQIQRVSQVEVPPHALPFEQAKQRFLAHHGLGS